MSGEPHSRTRVNQPLQKGQAVRTSDGHKLGKIHEIDPEYVVVSGGMIFWAKMYYVPVARIASVDRKTVHLDVANNDPVLDTWLTPPLPDTEPINPDRQASRATTFDVQKSDETEQRPTYRNQPPSPAPSNHVPDDADGIEPAPSSQEPSAFQAEHPAPPIPVAVDANAETGPVDSAPDMDAPAGNEKVPAQRLETRQIPDQPAPPEKLAPTTAAEENADRPPASPPKNAPVNIRSETVEESLPSNPTSAPRPNIPPRPASEGNSELFLDRRIEELKRKLNVAMKDTSTYESQSDTPGSPDPADRIATSSTSTEEDASTSRSRDAQMARDAAEGTYSNAGEQASRWTTPSSENAKNAASGTFQDARNQIRDWTQPDAAQAEDAASGTLHDAQDQIDAWTSRSGNPDRDPAGDSPEAKLSKRRGVPKDSDETDTPDNRRNS